jgi:CheY-like chemotaxis protein
MEKDSRQGSDRSSGPALLILHINDSTDDQVLLQAAVQRAGVPIQFHVADSVEHGISYLKSMLQFSRKREPRWIDLVVLDLILNDGTGVDVLKYIRDEPALKHLPVVVLTGSSDPAIQKKAHELGANTLFEKPRTFEDLVQLVVMLYEQWGSPAMRSCSQTPENP